MMRHMVLNVLNGELMSHLAVPSDHMFISKLAKGILRPKQTPQEETAHPGYLVFHWQRTFRSIHRLFKLKRNCAANRSKF